MASNAVDELREELWGVEKTSRCARGVNRFFSPSKVREIMSVPVLRKCLAELSICNDNPRDLSLFTSFINEHNYRVFAMLLLDGNEKHILQFVFRRLHDSNIPFSLETLHFLPEQVARQLVNRQQQLDPVILDRSNIHRKIGEDEIMPFLVEEPLAAGGFGSVYKVSILSSCQRLIDAPDDQAVIIARKELRNSAGGKAEHMILDLLSTLRHPNIIEFLGSYTQGHSFNLLFPHMAMNLLEYYGRRKFPSADVLYEGLSGISDALSKIHNFAFRDEHVELVRIGYHHDLGPKNILVQEDTFKLADFGLSNLKPTDEESKSLLRGGHEDYLSPESFDYEISQNNLIGRASDIWALGCILTEFVTVIEGKDIEEYSKARRAKFGTEHRRYTNQAFHLNGAVRPSVHVWLNALAMSPSDPQIPAAIELATEMLNPDPHTRVNAGYVSQKLFSLACASKRTKVKTSFEAVGSSHENEESDLHKLMILEHKHFIAWSTVYLGLEMSDRLPGMDRIMNALTTLSTSLDSFHGSRLEFDRVVAALDRTIDLLPQEGKQNITDIWVQEISSMQDPLLLRALHSASPMRRYRYVGAAAASSYMAQITTALVRNGSGSRMIGEELITRDRQELDSDCATTCIYKSERGPVNALVEWREYDHRWRFAETDLIFTTMDSLVNLLDPNVTARVEPVSHRVLDCAGYFHDKQNFKFGFVFTSSDTHRIEVMKACKVFTLHTVIRKTDPDIDPDSKRPNLGDIFHLAKDLASCLYSMHQMGWLHKNISSHSILVFSPSMETSYRYVRSAVLAGFADSRPDTSPITFGPKTDYASYQHPRYRKGTPYRRSFDYFSFGLVLLELGLGRTGSAIRSYHPELEDMEHAPGSRDPGARFAEKLVASYVPMLGERMGSIFRDAVRFCLECGDRLIIAPSQSLLPIETVALDQFRQFVVEPLSQLHA